MPMPQVIPNIAEVFIPLPHEIAIEHLEHEVTIEAREMMNNVYTGWVNKEGFVETEWELEESEFDESTNTINFYCSDCGEYFQSEVREL